MLTEETQWNTSWALADHLGTIRDWVDAATGSAIHYVYASFGRVLSIGGGDPTSDGHLFGYTGRETDADTLISDHWMYYRARYYNPSAGRFVSQDPIGFAAGDANLYRYVGNGVTGATDPDGLKKKLINVGRSTRDGKPGTYFQLMYFDSGWWSPRNVSYGPLIWKPDLVAGIPDLNGLGSDGLQASYDAFAAGADQCVQNTQAGVSATVIVAGMVLPGPDDVVIAAAFSKYGLKMIWSGGKRVLIKDKHVLSEVEARVFTQKVANELNKKKTALRYVMKEGYDLDWRGTSKTFLEAMSTAFERTGKKRCEFVPTKSARTKDGKTIVVEYRHPDGAKVSVDEGHLSDGPDAPHVGWQSGGKGPQQKRGHIILDEVPANRPTNKVNDE